MKTSHAQFSQSCQYRHVSYRFSSRYRHFAILCLVMTLLHCKGNTLFTSDRSITGSELEGGTVGFPKDSAKHDPNGTGDSKNTEADLEVYLTQEEGLIFIGELLNFTEDSSLDEKEKKSVSSAIRDFRFAPSLRLAQKNTIELSRLVDELAKKSAELDAMDRPAVRTPVQYEVADLFGRVTFGGKALAGDERQLSVAKILLESSLVTMPSLARGFLKFAPEGSTDHLYSAAANASQVSATPSATASQAIAAMVADGGKSFDRAMKLSDILVQRNILKSGKSGSKDSGICSLGLRAAVDFVEAQFNRDTEAACPDLRKSGTSCPSEATGQFLCKVGSTLLEKLFGELTSKSGPQCAIIKAAIDMWKNTHKVEGIYYPGGFCVECAMGAWSVFSINTCALNGKYQAPEEPCTIDLPTPSDPRCNASFYDVTGTNLQSHGVNLEQGADCPYQVGDQSNMFYTDASKQFCRVPLNLPGGPRYCVYIGTETHCQLAGDKCYYNKSKRQCFKN